MSKFKYRSHRGMLTYSMLTAREYESKQELLDYLQMKVGDNYDCSKVTIDPYAFDERLIKAYEDNNKGGE